MRRREMKRRPTRVKRMRKSRKRRHWRLKTRAMPIWST